MSELEILQKSFMESMDSMTKQFNKEKETYEKKLNELKEKYNKLKKDDDYSIFEKSSILMSFAELFSIQKSCELILRSNFSYIKVDKTKNNSIIYLSMKFLNEFINNLDEDSPSYFKLIITCSKTSSL